MTRDPGQLVLPSNIERTIAAPLDAATVVNELTSLLHEDTFKSIIDDNDYSYVGLIVSVINDPEPNNNGIYTLLKQPTTDINNWQKQQPNYDETLLTNSKHLVTAVNEIYTSAITRHDEFDTEINYVSSVLEEHIEDAKIKTDFVSANLVSASTILHNEILNTDTTFTTNLKNASSVLDTKINTTSSNLVDTLVTSSNVLDTKINTTSSNLINTVTLTSEALITQLETASSILDNKVNTTSSNLVDTLVTSSNVLDTKINTTSSNLIDTLVVSSNSLVTKIDTTSSNIVTGLNTQLELSSTILTNQLSLSAATLNTKINTTSSNLIDALILSSNTLSNVIDTTTSNITNSIAFTSSILGDEINTTNTNVVSLSTSKQDNLLHYKENFNTSILSASNTNITGKVNIANTVNITGNTKIKGELNADTVRAVNLRFSNFGPTGGVQIHDIQSQFTPATDALATTQATYSTITSAMYTRLSKSGNLAELADISAARNNLNVYSKQDVNNKLDTKQNNLQYYSEDVNNKSAVTISDTIILSGNVKSGIHTTTSGIGSQSEGISSIASGNASHAEGLSSIASGYISHAQGQQTISSGVASNSEGLQTHASGNASHAEGVYTKATGNYSHAEGWGSEASGLRSHAEGWFTKATATQQHVQGKYNKEDENKAFIIGNGTSENDRRNAFTVDWDGNIVANGSVTLSSFTLLNNKGKIDQIDNTIDIKSDNTSVPSTKAVKIELDKKQNNLTDANGVVQCEHGVRVGDSDYFGINMRGADDGSEVATIYADSGLDITAYSNILYLHGNEIALDAENIQGKCIESDILQGNEYKLPSAKAVKNALDSTKLELTSAINTIKSEVSTAYQFKGSDTYANILALSDMNIGDIWNSTTSNGYYPAGTNYAWTGEEWDALGGEVDLSAYQTKAITVAGLSATTVEGALAEVATEIDAKQDKLQTYSEHIDNEYTFANINASNVTITSEELKITGTSNFNINDDGVNGTLIETSLEGVEGNLASAKAIKTAIDTKADANASNLTTENVASWKAKLGFITSDEVPEQVQSDWNATSGKGAILNKPVIASTSPLILESVVGVAVNSANELHNNTVELEALCYSGEYITKVTIPSTHLYDYDAYICTVTLDNLYSGRTQYTFKIQSEYDKTYTISKILQECIYGSSVDMVDISTDENGVHMEIDGNCTHIYVTLTRIFTV